MGEVVKVNNLITKFGSETIHDGVNLTINEGEIYGILGGSGTGKSTLLREMIMLQEYRNGEIIIFGKNLKKMSSKEVAKFRLNTGVLFQFGALFSSLNVLENVSIPLKEYTNLPQELIKEIAYAKIEMVGLSSERVANLYPAELSGGMKKRVGLARALVLDPKLLFLDEPTSGLDPISAEAFDKLILELRNMLNLTVVMVTHQIETINRVLDRFSILFNKKVLFEGDLIEAKEFRHYALREFFKLDDNDFQNTSI